MDIYISQIIDQPIVLLSLFEERQNETITHSAAKVHTLLALEIAPHHHPKLTSAEYNITEKV